MRHSAANRTNRKCNCSATRVSSAIDACNFSHLLLRSALLFTVPHICDGRSHRRCRLRGFCIDRLPSALGLNMEQVPIFRVCKEKNLGAETDFDIPHQLFPSQISTRQNVAGTLTGCLHCAPDPTFRTDSDCATLRATSFHNPHPSYAYRLALLYLQC